MTDTHKPLPAAKVKELEEWLLSRDADLGIIRENHVGRVGRSLFSMRNAYEDMRHKLQSLINEAEDDKV